MGDNFQIIHSMLMSCTWRCKIFICLSLFVILSNFRDNNLALFCYYCSCFALLPDFLIVIRLNYFLSTSCMRGYFFWGMFKFFFFQFFVNHDFNLSCFCAEVTRLSSSLAGMLHVTWEMLVGNETQWKFCVAEELKQDLYSVRDTRINT